MDRHDLTDMEWNAIRKYLPSERRVHSALCENRLCSHIVCLEFGRRILKSGSIWVVSYGWRTK